MATEKNSTMTSRGSVLTTELNSLATGSYTAAGPEYDNTTQLDMWAIAELITNTFGVAPALNSPIHLFAVIAADGTNYQNGSSSLRPPDDTFVGTFQMYNQTAAQRVLTRPFRLKPAKMKFIVLNSCGQTMNAGSNTVGLFTYNRTVN